MQAWRNADGASRLQEIAVPCNEVKCGSTQVQVTHIFYHHVHVEKPVEVSPSWRSSLVSSV
eukprot:6491958-Amphidinium_carterae.5